MCHKIQSEIVIANYFAECNDQNELSLKTLSKIKNEIEGKFNDNGKYVFIDISSESLLNAINSNPRYFSINRENNSIAFNSINREELYEDVYGIFNSKLTGSIKFEFLKILEETLETNYQNSVA
jgi:hypothetical protein